MFGLLGLFVVATIGQALVGGATLIDANLFTRYVPWQSANGVDIANSNICRGDTLDTILPTVAQIRTSLLHGHFPSWSTRSVGGFSLGGIPNGGQFSPLSWPYFVLPLWLAPAFVKLTEFAVAIGGMVLYLRRLRASRAAGILAGIIFATSSFMVMWSNWPQTRVAALIPALFWSTELLVQRKRASSMLPLAVVVMSMLLGGFPSVTGMAIYAAAPYFLVRLVVLHRRDLRPIVAGLGYAVGALALGFGLSAFQLWPFAKQLKTVNLDYRQQLPSFHSSLSSLVTTFAGDSQGTCVNGQSLTPTNPIENVAYIGAITIVLALAAVFARSRMRGSDGVARSAGAILTVTLVVVVVVCWFGGPPLAALQHLPVFSNNAIGRIRSLFGFLVAALAGLGFDRLMRINGLIGPAEPTDTAAAAEAQPIEEAADEPETDSRVLSAIGAQGRGPLARVLQGPGGWIAGGLLTAVIALVLAAALKDAHTQAAVARQLHYFSKATRAGVELLIAGFLLLAGALIGPRWLRIVAIVLLPVLAVGQSVTFFREAMPTNNRDNFYPVTTTHSFLEANLGGDRFASSDNILYPATSVYYGLRTPVGHEFTQDSWKELLTSVDPQAMLTPTFSQFHEAALNAKTAGDLKVLDQLAVKYFVGDDYEIPGTVVAVPPTATTFPAGNGQQLTCPSLAGPLRAVTVAFPHGLPGTAEPGVTVHAEVQTPTGTISGARSLGGGFSSPNQISIAVPGEDIPAGTAVTAKVWTTGAAGTFDVSGAAGVPSCGTIAPVKDNLKLVHSDGGAIVYRRLSAVSRVHWASRSSVVTDPVQRLAALKAGLPDGGVILDSAAPAASGSGAKVTVADDAESTLDVDVDAQGSGYLVVADSMQQPGWSASVDGRTVPLVPANNAMVAVDVPAGQHRVVLRYTVPGLRLGTAASALSWVIFAVLVLLWWRRRRVVSHARTTGDTARSR
ncbi:YfhO family protein [Jatrophihabitans telluris]|uniref:YfhO family protein n=1 Tax=Jatrophihabitans telluris TaxID=2038343 RepID=A0ABY4QWR5_9ACTN|nr:YfhO family protein [Jatrophihabitans telluris]UQX87552.1 YfhO family protein [Jatrophihabitans telluris]